MNDDAEQYYKEYMNNSYDIEVTMPGREISVLS